MTTFTTTSPSGGSVPAGITEIGGVVLDLIGANGVRVTSELAASSLFIGYYDTGTPVSYQGNPGTIGIQGGFTSSVLSALGGGLASASVRITLYDGDTSSGDFDFGDNTLTLNGVSLGNFSSVNAQQTTSDGLTVYNTEAGFRDEMLSTGWFTTKDAATLASLFSSINSSGQIVYKVSDIDPYDNFYDFTQGLDGGLINVGQPLNISPIAGDDSATTAKNTAITINVASNDFDPDGSIVGYKLASGPGNGAFVLNNNNTITYTPNSNFVGVDSFTYTVTDNGGATSTATVSVTVTGTQTPPTSSGGIIFGNTDISNGDVSRVSDRGGIINDKLQSGYSDGSAFKDFQQFHGGDGSDTFILRAKDFGGTTQYNGLNKYITDFQGAGHYFSQNNDFISFTGFGTGSTLKYVDSRATTSGGPDTLDRYSIHDTATNKDFDILIHSLNGQKLVAGDYAFYA